MSYRKRIHYTEADKALMWDRWQQGESLHSIAKLFDRHHSAVRGILVRNGGIRPRKRRRSRLALSLAEREEISRAVMAGHSVRSIAASLDRAPSTVSRELCRNGGRQRYRANVADAVAWDRARRPKTCRLAEHRALARRRNCSVSGRHGRSRDGSSAAIWMTRPITCHTRRSIARCSSRRVGR